LALIVGARLGAYEILGQLGAGGMGEVYRARDSRLNRDVAIKILPEAYASDPDRVARFEREARAVAALNHPNIAAIYDFAESGDIKYLVLELVEGETLSDRLARGPISVDSALDIAIQILDALAAADEKGICHRDLKPANIKLSDRSAVKVLDFGLAKFLETSPDAATVTHSPMRTGSNVIMGTAGYMSPEQASGSTVDHRSDLFSVGCVLFEMLTGRRAFEGRSTQELISAVLTSDPPVQMLPRTLDAQLVALLERCLEKDPRERWHAAADVKFELRAIRDGAGHIGVGARRSGSAVWRSLMLVIASLAAGAAIVFGVMQSSWRPAPHRQTSRFVIDLPADQSLPSSSSVVLIALSPDGERFAYSAGRGIYVREMNEVEPRLVEGSRNASGPLTFSPDGRAVAFWNFADRKLKRLPVSGGTAVDICETGFPPPRSVSWDDQGIVFGQPGKGIMRVPSTGGTPELIVPEEPGESLANPQLLAGGRAVLFSAKKAADGWDKGAVVVRPLGGGPRRTLVESAAYGRVLPTGHLVYALEGALVALPFNARDFSVSGRAEVVVDGVVRPPDLSIAQYASSANGTLVFIPGPAQLPRAEEKRLSLFDRRGDANLLKLAAGNYQTPRVSRDGKWLAVTTEDRRGTQVSVYALDESSQLRQLTSGGKNKFPVWSPDALWIAFQSDREGDLAVFRQRADGSRAAERLTTPNKGEEHVPLAVSLDGTTLLLAIHTDMWTLWTMSIADRRVRPFGDARSINLIDGSFSRDGRWVVYSVVEPETPGAKSGFGRTYLQPYPATGAKYEVAGLGQPFWYGDDLVFNGGPGRSSPIISVQTKPSVALGRMRDLPRGGRIESNPFGLHNADAMPDGEHLVGVIDPAQARTQRIAVVLNWFDELRARVR